VGTNQLKWQYQIREAPLKEVVTEGNKFGCC
jgi:hypothetical protein